MSQTNKNAGRLRRAKRTRMRIRRQGALRLSVYRTAQHIYAQVINDEDSKVLFASSTRSKDVGSKLKNTGNVEAAKQVGMEIAKLAKKANVTKVAFDRSGYKYIGRVKALADAAREGGMEF